MTTHARLVRSLGVVLLLASPTAALAQVPAKAGLVINSSGAVSLIWHASERVALRPELGIAGAKVANSALDAEARTSNLSPGISLLFYTGPRENFRTYFSPRYVYGRSHSESDAPPPASSSESTVTTHTVSGSAGVEFSMHERLAAFGELGLTFSRSKIGATTNQNWTVRSVAGVIWYF